jgi:FXSXX-COOH protein
MNSAHTDPGIESDLIDLSGIPFGRLRDLDDTGLHQSMHRTLDRTTRLRGGRRSGQGGGEGERID